MTTTEVSKNTFGLVQLVDVNESHQKLEITHNNCSASISLYGGHVLTWQPLEQQPVFWLSDKATFTSGTAIRGGIPLCWPWFGSHQKGDVSGNHGFARQSLWQLEDTEISEDTVIITLLLSGENKHQLWPEKFILKQVLTFGKAFEQQLFISNLSEHEVEYSAAIHSYFQVSNPRNCTVPVLDKAKFDDKITKELSVSKLLKNCSGPIDRIYYSADTARLIDTKWQRQIEVSALNTQQWVLWNPGAEIAKNMADIHEHGENEYVCLEAANTQWQKVAPNQTVIIGQKVAIFPLIENV